MIRHLHLNGLLHGLQSRRDTNRIHVMMRLESRPCAYTISTLLGWEIRCVIASASHKFCIAILIHKLGSTNLHDSTAKNCLELEEAMIRPHTLDKNLSVAKLPECTIQKGLICKYRHCWCCTYGIACCLALLYSHWSFGFSDFKFNFISLSTRALSVLLPCWFFTFRMGKCGPPQRK